MQNLTSGSIGVMSVQDLVTEVEVALVEGDRLDKEILGPQLEPQFADCWLGL